MTTKLKHYTVSYQRTEVTECLACVVAASPEEAKAKVIAGQVKDVVVLSNSIEFDYTNDIHEVEYKIK